MVRTQVKVTCGASRTIKEDYVDNPWITLGTRLVYENPWLRLREDRVIRPDGKEGIYGVVEMLPSVGIVAVSSDGKVALVEQWRYVHEKSSIEIPTGGSEKGDPDVLGAARRELREETGLSAQEWRALGSIDNSNGATIDVAHLFFATRLSAGEPEQDEHEILKLLWLDFPKVVDMVLDGEITESVTVAAILQVELLRQRGEISI
jgi:8-oxo-dGTP pyrophosphatase MutT (NUDIX family)